MGAGRHSDDKARKPYIDIVDSIKAIADERLVSFSKSVSYICEEAND